MWLDATVLLSSNESGVESGRWHMYGVVVVAPPLVALSFLCVATRNHNTGVIDTKW